MRHITGRHYLLSLVLLVLFPLSALAMPAITCHCFTDRAYDPARPMVADPLFSGHNAKLLLCPRI
ncbi:hypothetical protein GEOBC_01197 [Geobacteraceae bacterium]|nr:hypothetical protein GEOBC_01197 [Geobacteraceae bacterium]